jgi:hypothetical protein
MASIEFINGNKQKDSGHRITYKTLRSVRRLINYILREDKTLDHLKGGIFCNPDTAYDEFILTKELYHKLPEGTLSKSNEVIHFVQSFKGQEATPELTKEVAEELLSHELFQGFQVLYAVHIDTDNVHVHFAINTVNYENGLRWHISKNDLQSVKDFSDEILQKHQLSIIPKRDLQVERNHRLSRHISSGEYRAKLNGRSWKSETLYAGMAAKKIARDKDEYISIMKSMGYTVIWKDSRKDITYITPQLKKINSDKLGFPERNFTPLTKETLEKQFALNRQVKENDYKSITYHQDQISKVINLARKITMKNPGQYPFQNSAMKARGTDGQARKDLIAENEKGKGLDWERD